ncbi:MAG TPA: glutathione transferase GstA [Dongiaceae bacterium]
MKLYYSPGACSLSPHIALREAGYKFDTEQVDLGTKKTKSGADYSKINPKGYVPALQLDNGELLTEGVAIANYLADQKPEANLLPKNGGFDRYRAQEWLTFVSSEIHKTFGPLFNPKTPDGYRTIALEKLGQRFDYLNKHLEGKQYLMGSQFTAADAYLFTVASWAPHLKVDLAKWPNVKAYVDRIAARPAVQAALKAEGLIQ